jgi:hypothetical protein
MNINFTPWAILWALLAVVVIVMAGYRKVISGKEDETLHLSNPTANTQQVVVGHKLEVIDKWGKLLTIIAAIFGLLLGLAYTYQTWVQSSRLGQ